MFSLSTFASRVSAIVYCPLIVNHPAWRQRELGFCLLCRRRIGQEGKKRWGEPRSSRPSHFFLPSFLRCVAVFLFDGRESGFEGDMQIRCQAIPLLPPAYLEILVALVGSVSPVYLSRRSMLRNVRAVCAHAYNVSILCAFVLLIFTRKLVPFRQSYRKAVYPLTRTEIMK